MDKVIKLKFSKTNPEFNDRTVWYNKMFLYHMRRHFWDVLQGKGYVYLNEIYEWLSLKWNPDDENLCFRKDKITSWCHKNWVIRECKDGTWNITIHYKPE